MMMISCRYRGRLSLLNKILKATVVSLWVMLKTNIIFSVLKFSNLGHHSCGPDMFWWPWILGESWKWPMATQGSKKWSKQKCCSCNEESTWIDQALKKKKKTAMISWSSSGTDSQYPGSPGNAKRTDLVIVLTFNISLKLKYLIYHNVPLCIALCARTLSGTYGFSADSIHLCRNVGRTGPCFRENRSDADGRVHDPNKILTTKRGSHQCWQALTPHPKQIQKATIVDNACPMDALNIHNLVDWGVRIACAQDWTSS